MKKPLILGSVILALGLLSQIGLIGQETPRQEGIGLAPTPLKTAAADIEPEILALFEKLQREAEQSGTPDAVERHADLRVAMLKYMNKGKFRMAIEILESTIDQMPNTDEARRAAAAIGLLQGGPLAPQMGLMPTPAAYPTLPSHVIPPRSVNPIPQQSLPLY